MENPCGESFTRGAAAAPQVRPVAVIAVALFAVWNYVHVDISSGTRVAERVRFGHAPAIVRQRASRCNFNCD